MVKKYIQITEPIEAIQWTGKNKDELQKFSNDTKIQTTLENKIITTSPTGMQMLWQKSDIGDYLVKDKYGDITVVSKEGFESNYVEVTDERHTISTIAMF